MTDKNERPFSIKNFTISAVLFSLFCSASFALSQVKHTVLTNGTDANRITIILLSEGYTSAELGQTSGTNKFLGDATNIVNNLLATQPFSEYRNFFNAHAVSVASPQSGSDHPKDSFFVNTYFSSTYDNTGNTDNSIITIPSAGEVKISALIQQFGLKRDLVIVVVNDKLNGGSAHSTGSTIVTSIGSLAPEIVAHEAGHSLAGLGDEYTTPNPGYPAIEEPNTTRQTNRNLIKWKAWIDDSTAIPTEPLNPSVVGLFEGAHYQTKGWYRPQMRCLMRTLDQPFCEVCKETLVKSFYQKIRPIESFSPASSAVSIPTSQSVSFNLSLLHPASHNLNIKWFVNGADQNHGDSSFSISQNSLAKGAYVVKAEIDDNTTMVRTDPLKLLHRSVSWNLYISDNTIVWQTANGQLAEWFMNGTTLLGSTALRNGQAVGINWRIVGLHDFNTDGHTDFLWEHTNGNLAIWYMDGLNLKSAVSLKQAATQEWRVVGLGDFNEDNQMDFVWQHDSGLLAVWHMNQNGTNLISSALLYNGKSVGRDWRIIGVKDFNNDSKADFLWQNTAGTLAIWYMDKLVLENSAILYNGLSVGPDWRVVGLKDLDNNGQIDFLWQHSGGTLGAWLRDNANSFDPIQLLGGQSVGTNWRIMGVK